MSKTRPNSINERMRLGLNSLWMLLAVRMRLDAFSGGVWIRLILRRVETRLGNTVARAQLNFQARFNALSD